MYPNVSDSKQRVKLLKEHLHKGEEEEEKGAAKGGRGRGRSGSRPEEGRPEDD